MLIFTNGLVAHCLEPERTGGASVVPADSDSVVPADSVSVVPAAFSVVRSTTTTTTTATTTATTTTTTTTSTLAS